MVWEGARLREQTSLSDLAPHLAAQPAVQLLEQQAPPKRKLQQDLPAAKRQKVSPAAASGHQGPAQESSEEDSSSEDELQPAAPPAKQANGVQHPQSSSSSGEDESSEEDSSEDSADQPGSKPLASVKQQQPAAESAGDETSSEEESSDDEPEPAAAEPKQKGPSRSAVRKARKRRLRREGVLPYSRRCLPALCPLHVCALADSCRVCRPAAQPAQAAWPKSAEDHDFGPGVPHRRFDDEGQPAEDDAGAAKLAEAIQVYSLLAEASVVLQALQAWLQQISSAALAQADGQLCCRQPRVPVPATGRAMQPLQPRFPQHSAGVHCGAAAAGSRSAAWRRKVHAESGQKRCANSSQSPLHVCRPFWEALASSTELPPPPQRQPAPAASSSEDEESSEEAAPQANGCATTLLSPEPRTAFCDPRGCRRTHLAGPSPAALAQDLPLAVLRAQYA